MLKAFVSKCSGVCPFRGQHFVILRTMKETSDLETETFLLLACGACCFAERD